MIKHIVLFKYKAEATPAQRKEVEDRLNALPGLIPDIKGWALEHALPGRTARAYDLALISEFDDVAALDRYIANPHHRAVIPLIDAACEHRAVFDYE